MHDFKKKNSFKSAFYSKTGLFFLILLVVFLTKAAFSAYGKVMESRDELARQEEEKKALEERKNYLSSAVEALSTKEGIEAEIREKFRMSKEGEHLIVVVEDSKESDGGQGSETGSWWSKLKHFFGQ